MATTPLARCHGLRATNREGGDWLGCAEALVAHGMPAAQPDPEAPDGVIVDGRRKRFSEEVRDYLLSANAALATPDLIRGSGQRGNSL